MPSNSRNKPKNVRAGQPRYVNPNKNVYNGAVPEVHNASTYTNWGCRCDECKAAWKVTVNEARLKRRERLLADPTLVEHGKTSTYENWMCRCEACCQAHSDRRWVALQRRRLRLQRMAELEGLEEDAS